MSLEGQQLGRYRLLRQIGSGGMGEVYLAEDPSINRQVAIKVVRTEAGGYPDSESSKGAARLFQREARAIAMLDHSYILPLYDYGEQDMNGARVAYLVMPYRQDGSLANWLQQGGTARLTLQDVEHMVQQAAGALQYAHDHQVIHQDVKPSNFLIRTGKDNSQHPDLLLTDFGIARLSTMTSSASQSIRGTPTYMAPEQWQGHPVPATDQYALAVMAYELLTGRPPFQGNPMQMMYAHVNTPPEPPSRRNARLSPAVDAVLLRALAKRPEERFPSIQAFALAFRQSLSGLDPALPVGAANANETTRGNTPSTRSMPGSGDIFATLAISEEEAQNGTRRTLTLPGGRQVVVSIPAGARDGQVIEVDDATQPGGENAVDKLHLTLSVQRALQNGTTSSPPVDMNTAMQEAATAFTGPEQTRVDDGPTALVTNNGQPIASWTEPPPSDHRTMAPPVSPLPITGEAGTMPYRSEPAIPVQPRKSSRSNALLLILLAIVLVLGSAGLFVYLGQHGSGGGGPNTGATATAQANLFATGTAQANGTMGANTYATSTAGASAYATATAQVNATAGAGANGATATPQGQPNATATAIAQGNATATAGASGANPYPPYSGTLTLNDPLKDNSKGYQWQVFNDSATGNSCQFTNSAYHAIVVQGYGGPCLATTTDFSNFTFEVQMTFLRAGQSFSGGGIAIRSSGGNYYYFEIFESGKYVFDACTGNNCSVALAENLSQSLPSFHAGLNQTNTLAIVANGNTFTLYVNGQRIAGPVTDAGSTSTHGSIGVYGEGGNATTEVVYSNAKIWA